MSRKSISIIGIMGLLTILFLAGCAKNESPALQEAKVQEVTVFKSNSCGCCGAYVQYMQQKGFTVNVQTVTDITQIKDQFSIPANMESCHTTKIGNYFVEGHVPIEAIDNLLTEKPDIAGIALPAMPSGSPGMPGGKTGAWIVYAINHDRTSYEFMRI